MEKILTYNIYISVNNDLWELMEREKEIDLYIYSDAMFTTSEPGAVTGLIKALKKDVCVIIEEYFSTGLEDGFEFIDGGDLYDAKGWLKKYERR